jgi:hypothetical protein
MQDGDIASVSIELRVGADPIQGLIVVGGRPPRPFRGWIALTALLDRAALGRRDQRRADRLLDVDGLLPDTGGIDN